MVKMMMVRTLSRGGDSAAGKKDKWKEKEKEKEEAEEKNGDEINEKVNYIVKNKLWRKAINNNAVDQFSFPVFVSRVGRGERDQERRKGCNRFRGFVRFWRSPNRSFFSPPTSKEPPVSFCSPLAYFLSLLLPNLWTVPQSIRTTQASLRITHPKSSFRPTVGSDSLKK